MKHLKSLQNISVILIIGCLILSACSSGASSSNSEDEETYKVGYTNFFSGKNAAEGKIVDTSVKMALEDFNKDAKVPVKLLTEDIGDTAITARNGYEKLLANNPSSLLTFISSPNFLGVSALLENARIPVVLANNLGTIYEHGWDWVFGTQTPSSMEAPLAIKYFHNKLGKSKIAVIVSNDDTGKSVLASLKDVAKENNITIIPELVNSGDNDFTANITSVRRQNPDMYYVNVVLVPDIAKIIKQMRQLGIQETISVNNNISKADFKALLSQKELEGLYGHNTTFVNPDDQKIQAFSKKFKEKTGHEADTTSLFVYDSAMIMFNAVSKAGKEKQKIVEALRATQYTGLAGSYKFDSKGRGRTDTNILQMGPNKAVKLLGNVKFSEE